MYVRLVNKYTQPVDSLCWIAFPFLDVDLDNLSWGKGRHWRDDLLLVNGLEYFRPLVSVLLGLLHPATQVNRHDSKTKRTVLNWL